MSAAASPTLDETTPKSENRIAFHEAEMKGLHFARFYSEALGLTCKASQVSVRSESTFALQ